MKYYKFLMIFLVFLCLGKQGFAYELRAPDEIELKSAYCAAVLKITQADILEFQKSILPNDALAKELDLSKELDKEMKKSLDNLNRVQSFLMPRLDYIDTDALMFATARGIKDYKNPKNSALIKECQNKCRSTKPATVSVSALLVVSECIIGCTSEDELFKRLQQCNDLDFLPY